jgi:hypothetical protein
MRLRSGDPGDDTKEAMRQMITIGEYDNQKNGIEIAAGQSSITIDKGGAISIDSKNEINLKSSDTVIIEGEIGVGLSSPNGQVVAKGHIKHKNFEILA